MCPHRFSSTYRIAGQDGLKNALVVILPALRSPLYLEDAESLLPQHSDNRIDQRKDERVCRCFSQSEVKIEVCFDERIGIAFRGVHDLDCFAKFFETFFRYPGRRQGGNLRFQDFSYLDQMQSYSRGPAFIIRSKVSRIELEVSLVINVPRPGMLRPGPFRVKPLPLPEQRFD